MDKVKYIPVISIHALREESDRIWYFLLPHIQTISIHALREESDPTLAYNDSRREGFQSTLSVRRATELNAPNAIAIYVISIHALREESDLMSYSTVIQHTLFQSTLSVRRATNPLKMFKKGILISIHALREESDQQVLILMITQRTISIHALREESDG